MPRSSEDINLDEKMFCMFKGDPATGKSPAAASFPEPYFLDLEGRIASTANYWRGKKKFSYDTYINKYPQMMDRLEKLINYNPYGTVVMDGFTALSRSLNNLSFVSRGNAPAPKKGKDERFYEAIGVSGDFKGIQRLQIDDYMTESNGIVQVLDAMRALWNDGRGCHCICIGHVIETQTEDFKGNVKKTRRMMTGGTKIAAEIPVYFNEAYHFTCTTLGDREYKIITKNDGEDWAKTVLPLPDVMDFTNKNLYDEIRGYVDNYKTMNPEFFVKKEELT